MIIIEEGCKMSLSAQLQQLSLTEKLSLVMDLWEDIARAPEPIPSPEWHKTELLHREQKREGQSDVGDDWDVVKKRLQAEL